MDMTSRYPAELERPLSGDERLLTLFPCSRGVHFSVRSIHHSLRSSICHRDDELETGNVSHERSGETKKLAGREGIKGWNVLARQFLLA